MIHILVLKLRKHRTKTGDFARLLRFQALASSGMGSDGFAEGLGKITKKEDLVNINNLCENCAAWAGANRWTACFILFLCAVIGIAIAYWQNRRALRDVRLALCAVERRVRDLNVIWISVKPSSEHPETAVVVCVALLDSSGMQEVVQTSHVATFVHEAGLLLTHFGWDVTFNGMTLTAVPFTSRVLRVQALQPRHVARTAA